MKKVRVPAACRNSPCYPELFALVGPQVPDLRGLFLRGLGGNSSSLGVLQSDAIRNIQGEFRAAFWENSGSFKALYASGGTWSTGSGTFSQPIVGFDASRVVPTAVENRPVNMAVRYLMRARR